MGQQIACGRKRTWWLPVWLYRGLDISAYPNVREQGGEIQGMAWCSRWKYWLVYSILSRLATCVLSSKWKFPTLLVSEQHPGQSPSHLIDYLHPHNTVPSPWSRQWPLGYETCTIFENTLTCLQLCYLTTTRTQSSAPPEDPVIEVFLLVRYPHFSL